MATTPNLGLHQWQAGDSFLRTDFNEDFSKLDTAVGGKARMVYGHYTGNAVVNLQDDSGNNRDISLGFTPQAVLVYRPTTGTSSGYANIGMALTGKSMTAAGYSVLEIIPGGFRVGSTKKSGEPHYPAFNTKDYDYYYVAFV